MQVSRLEVYLFGQNHDPQKEKIMHDLDRTQNLFESEFNGMETFDYEGEGEGEDEGEGEEEFQDEGQYEGEGYLFEGESESAFDEIEEMELAADFLEVTDDAELDQFLGKLIKRAKKAAGGFVKSGLGQQIGGLLKGAAKQALPALGNLALPGVGGQAGAKLGQLFGLELEGLSPEDQEFEAARKFVRFAGEVAQAAAGAPPGVPAPQAANAAVIQAAQKHAPGLLRPANGRRPVNRCGGVRRRVGGRYAGRGTRGGRWVRRGDRIILLGV
jgi:hypothetical protein